MDANSQQYQEIAALIHSDNSPVGIDAKKTHILIIQLLQEIQARLETLEQRLDELGGTR
jgi:hypothetical protein